MADTYRIARGLPDEEPLLHLLNECFENWGDAAFLAWKYTRPGDDAATGYRVVRDGELVGFRGMFERTIEGEVGGYAVTVCGDACVSPDHRGAGIYSRIREATESAIEREGRDCCGLFTRKGHIPFEVGLERGWDHRTLPLYIRVLSPGSVVPHYARLVLDDEGAIATALDRFGDRVTLRSGGDEIRLDGLLGGATDDARRSLPVPFPAWATTAAVEVAGRDSLAGSLRRRLSAGRPDPPSNVDGGVETAVDEALVASMTTLYEAVTDGYDLAFGRSAADVRHMLAHPGLVAVVTAHRRGRLVGAAPVALTETADTLEAWVLDVAAEDEGAYATLLDGVETVATDRGADMLLLIADADPGREWARIDKQVLMWDSYGADTDPLRTGSLFAGLYDVV